MSGSAASAIKGRVAVCTSTTLNNATKSPVSGGQTGACMCMACLGYTAAPSVAS